MQLDAAADEGDIFALLSYRVMARKQSGGGKQTCNRAGISPQDIRFKGMGIPKEEFSLCI